MMAGRLSARHGCTILPPYGVGVLCIKFNILFRCNDEYIVVNNHWMFIVNARNKTVNIYATGKFTNSSQLITFPG